MAGCTNVLRHNLRQGQESDEYFDTRFEGHNRYEGVQSASEFHDEYQRMIDEANLKRKIQKNASRIIEFVLSSSHEYCNDWAENPESKKKLDRYFQDSHEFLKAKYGDVIISSVVHYDETTPHLHVMCVPLVKNPETEDIKFSSSAFVGGMKELYALHTEFYEQVGKKHNLERGAMGSRTKHSDLKQYKEWESRQRRKLIQTAKSLEKRETNIKAHETILGKRQTVVEKKENYYASLEKEVQVKTPEIPVPPFALKEKDRSVWRDKVQLGINKAFAGLTLAYRTIRSKFNDLVGQYNDLVKKVNLLKERAEKAERDLAVKPLGEIQAERDKRSRAIEARKRERSQEGVSR